jgi:ferredoxin-NADP reductase
MVVTKGKKRHDRIHSALVVKLEDISPTTKALDLQVRKADDGAGFVFSPGQWLDVFIPGLDVVGGFSLTSTPKNLIKTGLVSLAVKYSSWPPSHWFHTKCSVGSELTIRCGGDFVLEENPSGDFVFLAGGVGINPMASMIFHLLEENYNKGKITLLYSAKSVEELLFKGRFDELRSANPNFQVQYFVTGGTVGSGNSAGTENRRITAGDLAGYLRSDVVLYVCGPSSLIELGKSQSNVCKQIKFEQWW